jgi:predicted rRNA methylase YqxC with S4 and FtsJ domains
VLERVNARALTELPFAPDLVVCDVSFISVTKRFPPCWRLQRRAGRRSSS